MERVLAQTAPQVAALPRLSRGERLPEEVEGIKRLLTESYFLFMKKMRKCQVFQEITQIRKILRRKIKEQKRLMKKGEVRENNWGEHNGWQQRYLCCQCLHDP